MAKTVCKSRGTGEIWRVTARVYSFLAAMMPSYLDLLDHQRRKGIPREGRVITAKAAQSSCKGRVRPAPLALATHHVCRELALVVPAGDDDALAGVGGQADHGRAALARRVDHLRRREVEVAELLGPHHHGVRGVGAGRHTVQPVLGLPRHHVEVLLPEAGVGHLHVGGRVVTDVEEVVLDHDIHSFYQELVAYLHELD